MPFTDEDKVLIKHYRLTKGYGRKNLLKEFPEKNWSKTGLQKLLKKIDETGDINRKQGSGRPIDSFRKRFRMVIQQNDGHIEKYI